MNKYQRWYQNITDRARMQNIQGYVERHHVIPRSLGGSDEPANLVNLTAREHFICHWLLVKITTGKDHHKMLNALRIMRAEKNGQQRYNTKITARVYENIKQEYAKLQSKTFKGKGNGFYGKHHTPEAKAAISKKNKGKKPTEQQIANQKLAITGRKRKPFSEEHRTNMSKSKQGEGNGMYGKIHSDETRSKQSAKAIGRKQSQETIQKKADAIRGTKREKKLCVHCNTMIAVNGYVRWHGANCRQKADK